MIALRLCLWLCLVLPALLAVSACRTTRPDPLTLATAGLGAGDTLAALDAYARAVQEGRTSARATYAQLAAAWMQASVRRAESRMRAGHYDAALDALGRLPARQRQGQGIQVGLALPLGYADVRAEAHEAGARDHLARAEAALDAGRDADAFAGAAFAQRYEAPSEVAGRIEDVQRTAGARLSSAAVATARRALDADAPDEALRALGDLRRWPVPDSLRGPADALAATAYRRATLQVLADVQADADAGRFDAALQAHERLRRYTVPADLAEEAARLRYRVAEQGLDAELATAETAADAGAFDDALQRLASARRFSAGDALAQRLRAARESVSLQAVDLYVARAYAAADEGDDEAAQRLVARAASFELAPALPRRLSEARAGVTVRRAGNALRNGRFRDAYALALAVDTARTPLPDELRHLARSTRETARERGSTRVLLMPPRSADSLDATRLALELRLRARAREEAPPFVDVIGHEAILRAIGRTRHPATLTEGDAAALARSLDASVLVFVTVVPAARDTVHAMTEPEVPSAPTSHRTARYRILDARTRRLLREGTAAAGDAPGRGRTSGTASADTPDARHDRLADALLARLYADVEALAQLPVRR